MVHYIDLISKLRKNKRNYLEKVIECDKAACAESAKRFGEDYWEGDRKSTYGGFRYDGRGRILAEGVVKCYGLRP